MYNVDIFNIILEQLPQAVKTLFNAKVHEWWLTPVKWMHQDARAQGLIHYQWATTTSQGGSMEATLNANFDPGGNQIYITDVEWLEDTWIYLEGEPYDPIYIFQDSEDISEIEDAEQVYLFSDEDMNTIHFIVWIPESLNTEEWLEQIAAMVDDHKYAGKNYVIQVIE